MNGCLILSKNDVILKLKDACNEGAPLGLKAWTVIQKRITEMIENAKTSPSPESLLLLIQDSLNMFYKSPTPWGRFISRMFPIGKAMILFNNDTNTQLAENKTVSSTFEETAKASRLLRQRNFLENKFKRAPNAKLYFLRSVKSDIVETFLVRRNGSDSRYYTSLKEMNESVKEYKQALLDRIFAYFDSDSLLKNIVKNLPRKMYDADDVYTGIIQEMKPVIDNHLSPEAIIQNEISLDYIYKDYRGSDKTKQKIAKLFLDAYNAWIILQNFDTVIRDTSGSIISVGNSHINQHDHDLTKYSIKNRATNMWTNWRDSDDIADMSEIISEVTQLLIETSKMYKWGANTPYQDRYLSFNDFNYIVGFIKRQAFMPTSDSIVISELADVNNLSIHTKRILSDILAWNKANQYNIIRGNVDTGVPKPVTWKQLVARLNENPQKYMHVIFDILCNTNIMDTNEFIEGSLKFLNTYTKNIIWSFYKEAFGGDGNPRSLFALHTRSTQDNVYQIITQVAASTFPEDYLQYYERENGVIGTRLLKDYALDSISNTIATNIQQTLATLSKADYKKYGITYQTQLNNKDLLNDVQINIKINNDLNFNISIDSNKVTIPEYSSQEAELIWNNHDVQTLFKDLLGLNFEDDPDFKEAYLETVSSYPAAIKNLGQLLGRAVFNTIINTLFIPKYLNLQNNVSIIKNFIKSQFGDVHGAKYADKFNTVTGEMPIIHPDRKSVDLNNLALATALNSNLLAQAQSKTGEGTSLANYTLSRMRNFYQNQLEIQCKKANSAVKNLSFVVNSNGLFEGILSRRELKTLNSNQQSTKFSDQLSFELSFINDFVAAFVPNPNSESIIKEGKASFLPTVNSDKTQIDGLLVNLNAKSKVTGKSYLELTDSDIEQEMVEEFSPMYERIITNINTELGKVASILGLNVSSVAGSVLQQNEVLLNYINTKFASDKRLGKKPKERIINGLHKIITEYNKTHSRNPIMLSEHVHYIFNKEGLLTSNKTLEALHGRFGKNVAESDRVKLAALYSAEPDYVNYLQRLGLIDVVGKESFFSYQDYLSIENLLKMHFKVYLRGSDNVVRTNQPEIAFLKGEAVFTDDQKRMQPHLVELNEQMKDWVDDAGMMIIAKGYITNLRTGKPELINITTLDQLHQATNIEVHPMLRKLNRLDYLCTQQYTIATVGSHYVHKGSAGVGSIITEEAKRWLASNKRNVAATSTVHLFQNKQLDGVPSIYNIAIIEDIRTDLYNVMGDLYLEGHAPLDGGMFVNAWMSELENNSLAGEKAGLDKKQFGTFYSELYGAGGIVKTAGFAATNARMRRSKAWQNLQRNMTSRPWIKELPDENGNDIYEVIDITKCDYRSESIDYTQAIGGKPIMYKRVAHDNPQLLAAYRLENIKSLGNNQYEITEVEINKNGTEINEPVTRIETINSNWDLYTKVFGGYNSLELDANNTLTWSENSIKLMVYAMNNIGYKKQESVATTPDGLDLDDVWQPLKYSDVHYTPNIGAIKSLQFNVNPDGEAVLSSETTLNFMQMRLAQLGIQLDKEHHADAAEVSMPTQLIQASANRSFTHEYAQEMYKALSILTRLETEGFLNGISDIITAGADSKNPQAKLVEEVTNLIVDKLLHESAEDNSVNAILKDLLEKAETGKTITFADDIKGKIPWSDPTIFNKLFSALSTTLTNIAVKMKFSGTLSVICPTGGIEKRYGDRGLNSFTLVYDKNREDGSTRTSLSEISLLEYQESVKNGNEVDSDGRNMLVYDSSRDLNVSLNTNSDVTFKTSLNVVYQILNKTLTLENSFNRLKTESDEGLVHAISTTLEKANAIVTKEAIEYVLNIVNVLKTNDIQYDDVLKYLLQRSLKKLNVTEDQLNIIDSIRQGLLDTESDIVILPYRLYKEYEFLINNTTALIDNSEYNKDKKGFEVTTKLFEAIKNLINLFGDTIDVILDAVVLVDVLSSNTPLQSDARSNLIYDILSKVLVTDSVNFVRPLLISPTKNVDSKAVIKGKLANKFIGYAEGIEDSSTAEYALQSGGRANVGNYDNNDIVFVSILGKIGSDEIRHLQLAKTILEALIALNSGATLITDNKLYVESSDYNEGEKKLAAALLANGGTYFEEMVDGELLGFWKKENNNNLHQVKLSKISELKTQHNYIIEFADGSKEEITINTPEDYYRVKNLTLLGKKTSTLILWAHPAIGKTYSVENGGFSDKLVDWDVEFNRKRDLWIAQHSKTLLNSEDFKRARNEYLINWENHPEYTDFVKDEWERVKQKANRENKILVASPHMLLKLFPQDFTKVITMSEGDFVTRNVARNANNRENSIKWKAGIDQTISDYISNSSENEQKVVTVLDNEYLENLLLNGNLGSELTQLASNESFENGNIAVVKMYENVLKGRELSAYNVRFSDSVSGERFQIFDLDSINLLYKLNNISDKQVKGYPEFSKLPTQQQLVILNQIFKSSAFNAQAVFSELQAKYPNLPMFDLNFMATIKQLYSNKAYIDIILELYRIAKPRVYSRMQHDLFKLSANYKGKDRTIWANGKQIDPMDFQYDAYEVILPMTYKTQFGLLEYDDLQEILKDPDFFVKRGLLRFKSKIDDSMFDYELKSFNGNHVYVLDSSKGIPEEFKNAIQAFETKLSKGKTYRIDSDGNVIYQMSSDSDAICSFNGIEVIVTDNPLFYVLNFNYNTLRVSPKRVTEESYLTLIETLSQSKRANSKNFLKAILNSKGEYMDIKKFKQFNTAIDELNYDNVHLNTEIDDEFKSISLIYRIILLNGKELHTSFAQSLEFIAGRIPAQSQQSFMTLRVVGFDNSGLNTAMVSTFQLFLLGSDLDIDAVTLLGYDFDDHGKLIGWSPYFSLESKEMLKASKQLPLPTGKTQEVITGKNAKHNFFEVYDKYFGTLFKTIQIGNNKIKTIDGVPELLLDIYTPQGIALLAEFLRDVEKYGIGIKAELNENGFIEADEQFFKAPNIVLGDGTLMTREWSLFRKPLNGGTVNVRHDLTYAIAQQLVKFVNDHNEYINTVDEYKKDSMAKNYIVHYLYKVAESPCNQTEAMKSVDESTKVLKAGAAEFAEQSGESRHAPGRVTSKVMMIGEGQAGKDGVGIGAVGIKANSTTQFYLSELWRNGSELDKRKILFTRGKSIDGKYYRGFANMYTDLEFSEEEVQKFSLAMSLLDNLREEGDLTKDVAEQIAAMLSIAVDNAKDLALAKINSGPRLMGMYVYGMTLGIPTETLIKIMTSPEGLILKEMTEGSYFNRDTNAFRILDVFDKLNGNIGRDLERFSYIAKTDDGKVAKHLTDIWLEDGGYFQTVTTSDAMFEALYNPYIKWYDTYWSKIHKTKHPAQNLNLMLAHILAEPGLFDVLYKEARSNLTNIYLTRIQGVVKPEIALTWMAAVKQTINYIQDIANKNKVLYAKNGRGSDLRILAEGAEEMRVLGSILSMNKGLKPTPAEAEAFVDVIENLIYDRKKIMGYEPFESDKIDFIKFMTDSRYLELVINEYEQVKHSVNIPHLLTKVPHFKGYVETQMIPVVFEMVASVKYRTLQKYRKNINADNKSNAVSLFKYFDVNSKKDKESVLRGLENLVLYKLLTGWLFEKKLQFTIPAGFLYFDKTGEITTSDKPEVINLWTKEGLATFKKYMDEVYIPSLKNNPNISRTNEFIKNLIKISYDKTPTHSPTVVYSLQGDLMARKGRLAELNLAMFADFLLLGGEAFKEGIKFKSMFDAFYLYAQYCYMGRKGTKSLMGLFDSDNVRGGLAKSFSEYVAKMDIDGNIFVSSEELTAWCAPVGTQNLKANFGWIKGKDNVGIQLKQKIDPNQRLSDEEMDVLYDDDSGDGYTPRYRDKFGTYKSHFLTHYDRTVKNNMLVPITLDKTMYLVAGYIKLQPEGIPHRIDILFTNDVITNLIWDAQFNSEIEELYINVDNAKFKSMDDFRQLLLEDLKGVHLPYKVSLSATEMKQVDLSILQTIIKQKLEC